MGFGFASAVLAPDWETRLWSDRTRAVRTVEGFSIGEVAGPTTLDWADLVIIPSWPLPLSPISEPMRVQLSRAHARGTPIVGLCLGAFAVADAGFLAGRSAVTHWEMMPTLAERHPSIHLDESVLYIDHGDVMTSAGTASSIDACLHLVRKHLGSAVATRVARNPVVAPHREGAQAQYIERALAEPATDTAISDLLEMGARTARRVAVRRTARRPGADESLKFHTAVPSGDGNYTGPVEALLPSGRTSFPRSRPLRLRIGSSSRTIRPTNGNRCEIEACNAIPAVLIELSGATPPLELFSVHCTRRRLAARICRGQVLCRPGQVSSRRRFRYYSGCAATGFLS